MKCVNCGDYFKRSQWNKTNECENCLDTKPHGQYDTDYEADVEVLKNPTGKTPAIFYDE